MWHGNLTSDQVILNQEIQFPGMDFVFFSYTLPVYPHPASQRFSLLICLPLTPEGPMSFLKKCVVQELVSTICHGCPGTSGTDAELSVVCWTTCFSISESVTYIWIAYGWGYHGLLFDSTAKTLPIRVSKEFFQIWLLHFNLLTIMLFFSPINGFVKIHENHFNGVTT